MRAKGQSTLAMPTCFGQQGIPFLLDFRNSDNTQRMYGVETMYLRTHMSDTSHAREWTIHRILAKAGLPHLRTRTVVLWINGNRIGLYDALEAPAQEYVFHRSFPTYNIQDFSLFKVKSMSSGCGDPATFNDDAIAAVEKLGIEPPYAFTRGSHRDKIDNLGFSDPMQCMLDFYDMMGREKMGVVHAYGVHGKDCGEMLVEEASGVPLLQAPCYGRHRRLDGALSSFCWNRDTQVSE